MYILSNILVFRVVNLLAIYSIGSKAALLSYFYFKVRILMYLVSFYIFWSIDTLLMIGCLLKNIVFNQHLKCCSGCILFGEVVDRNFTEKIGK